MSVRASSLPRLRCGLNAGFGETIAHELFGITEHRFTDVRQDLTPVMSPETLRSLMNELRASSICPLWIMRENQIAYAKPCERVEFYNEPNLNGFTPEMYAEAWNRVAGFAYDRNVVLFAGSISNLNKSALSWLRQTWARMTVKPRYVSVHRYAEVTGGSQKPHSGFANREQEVDALRQIVGDATIALTEFGYHTGARKLWGWWPLKPYTDAQVAHYVTEEWQFWSSQNIESAYLYQLNDGPSTQPDERYGIRTFAGVWKPSAISHYCLST